MVTRNDLALWSALLPAAIRLPRRTFNQEPCRLRYTQNENTFGEPR